MIAPDGANNWDVVARVDQKIANALTFLLFIVALFPFLFAVFERIRLQEVDKLRDDLKEAQEKIADRQAEQDRHGGRERSGEPDRR